MSQSLFDLDALLGQEPDPSVFDLDALLGEPAAPARPSAGHLDPFAPPPRFSGTDEIISLREPETEERPGYYLDERGRWRPVAEKAVRALTEPLPPVVRAAERFQAAVDRPEDSGPVMAGVRGFAGQAARELAGMSSPVDVAMTVGPLAAGRVGRVALKDLQIAEAAARAARAETDVAALAAATRRAEEARRVAGISKTASEALQAGGAGMSVPGAVRGVGNVAEGISEGDLGQVGRGVFETGMAGVNFATALPRRRAPAPAYADAPPGLARGPLVVDEPPARPSAAETRARDSEIVERMLQEPPSEQAAAIKDLETRRRALTDPEATLADLEPPPAQPAEAPLPYTQDGLLDVDALNRLAAAEIDAAVPDSAIDLDGVVAALERPAARAVPKTGNKTTPKSALLRDAKGNVIARFGNPGYRASGVKESLGLDGIPGTRKQIAEAIRKDADNPLYLQVKQQLKEKAFEAGYRPPVASDAVEPEGPVDTSFEPAQFEAAAPAKGPMDWNGLKLNIEVEKGGTRVGPNGRWRQENLPAAYGRIQRTKGADGEHVDIYMGDDPAAQSVFVIDQVNAETQAFDEHKVMAGFRDAAEAQNTYVRAFSDGKGAQRLGGMTEMTVPEFREWLDSGQMKNPASPTRASAIDKTAAGDQMRLEGTIRPESAPRIRTEGREVEGPLFTQQQEAAARAEQRSQQGLFGSETGALRFGRAPERVQVRATGESGTIAKYNDDGTVTIDVGGKKSTVQPEAVRFLGPEPLAAPRKGPTAPEAGTPPPPEGPQGDLFAGPGQPETPERKLMRLVKERQGVNRKTERLRHPERVVRANEAGRVFSEEPTFEGFKRARNTLRGEYSKAEFKAGPEFTQEDADGLMRKVAESDLMPFEQLNAAGALADLLQKGRPNPGKYDLDLLSSVFGNEFVDTLARRNKWKDLGLDLINFPRAFTASFDMSAPLRQGLVLGAGHPVRAAQSFAKMHAFFARPKVYEEFVKGLRSDPALPLAQESGLYLASLRIPGGKSLAGGEELFRSHFAEKIPVLGAGVRASERAYIGYLDKLRFDVWKDTVRRFEAAGIDPDASPEVYKSLASWINTASGRGNLGKYGERVGGLLSQGFFSPRFIAARVRTLNPATYVQMPPAVRKEAARSLVSLAAAGLSVTGLAAAAGAKVETDWRSTDFGKIRIGHTRIDPWGGFQPYVKLVAQLATGERKTMSGATKPLDGKGPFPETRKDQVVRFVEQKFSPQAGLVRDFLNAWKDPGGNPITLEGTAFRTFLPMFIQDTYDAIEAEGLGVGLGTVPLTFYGAGVNTYRTPEEALAKDKRRQKQLREDARRFRP